MMQQSFLLISEISQEDLLHGLIEFANSYADQQFSHNIVLSRKENEFLVLFSNVPSFDHFAYAVNYLRYLRTTQRNLPSIFGYYVIKQTGEKYPFLVGEFAKVYVSKNDDQHDNVNVVNQQNHTYLFDFGGKQNRLSIIEEPFDIPQIDAKRYQHIFNILPEPVEDKPWWKFW